MPVFLSSKDYVNVPQSESHFYQQLIAERAQLLRRYRWITVLLVGTNVLLAIATAWLGTELRNVTRHGSFARGLATELAPAKHLIELQNIQFTGSPHFLDNGHEYVPDDGVQRPQYIGEPNDSIDHEWTKLHWGRFFLLSEDEARQAWGSNYQEYWNPRQSGNVAALEVMHTLHCLDHIRKAFHPEHYPVDSPAHGAMHRDHCIDHLRQTVMCNADLTPIPSRFYMGLHRNYIDSDRMHTCRNFDRVREWVSERYNGSLAVLRKDGKEFRDYQWE